LAHRLDDRRSSVLDRSSQAVAHVAKGHAADEGLPGDHGAGWRRARGAVDDQDPPGPRRTGEHGVHAFARRAGGELLTNPALDPSEIPEFQVLRGKGERAEVRKRRGVRDLPPQSAGRSLFISAYTRRRPSVSISYALVRIF